jgi:hypothetical protein
LTFSAANPAYTRGGGNEARRKDHDDAIFTIRLLRTVEEIRRAGGVLCGDRF